MPILHGSGNAERNAYGTALFCLGRRIYVLLFCAVMAFICLFELGRLLYSYGIVSNDMHTLPPKACSGLECYEVFSCRGFTWTTDEIRRVLLIAPGAVMFPLGVHAALHGYRLEMKLVSFYLMLLTAAYVGCFIGDWVYYDACSAYPGDVVDQTLLWPIPFPLRRAAQDQLAKMTFFPMADVDKITHDFGTMNMYSIMAAIVCFILAYSTYEIMLVAHLLERGPLGLGVHYGLGQFDEIINHAELQKMKMPKSKFVDDCNLPTYNDAEAPLTTAPGYHLGHNYGAFYGDSLPAARKDAYVPKEQFEDSQAGVSRFNAEYARAKEAHDEALKAQQHFQEDITEKEREAQGEVFNEEVNRERQQEYRAQELAQEAADQALAEAEYAGCPPHEARMRMAVAYQSKLANLQYTMANMAKATALHAHHEHAHREEDYRHEREELVTRVQETREDLQKAEERMRQAQATQGEMSNFA